MSIAALLPIFDRFSLSLDGLCRAVAARIAGGAMSAVMIVLVWQRIRRIETRMKRLLARFLAGTLRVGVGAGTRGARGRSGGGARGLPCGFGWLLVLVPHVAANYAGQIRSVMAEPEMAALLAAVPQARRVMAPLCRMLGIAAEVLAAPVVAAVVAPVAAWSAAVEPAMVDMACRDPAGIGTG